MCPRAVRPPRRIRVVHLRTAAFFTGGVCVEGTRMKGKAQSSAGFREAASTRSVEEKGGGQASQCRVRGGGGGHAWTVFDGLVDG